MDNKKKFISSFLFRGFLIAFSVFAFSVFALDVMAGVNETLYEDAEDSRVDGWHIYDSTPTGASFLNVFDAERGSQVIELNGSGRSNGFKLRNGDLTLWGNTNQFFIDWSMNFSESFRIYVDIETTVGRRYLTYEPVDDNGLGNGSSIYYGLGAGTSDGSWIKVTRDLQSDLQQAQPGAEIVEVNSFMVRGSGRVDDIKLWSAETPVGTDPDLTVYEDAEDAATMGWDIYDSSPQGAVINNVFDSEWDSQVIEVTGSNRRNGFRLRSEDHSNWGNTEQTLIQWSMRFDEPYRIYVDVATTAGNRYLTYEPVDEDDLGVGDYISYGLGSNTDDGRWVTVTRDLRADLNRSQPDLDITAVNAFLVRGSGRLDDIQLMKSHAESIYEDSEDAATAGWNIYDASPAGAAISNVFDPERDSRVIEITGSRLKNGFELRNADLSPWGNTEQLVVQWSMRFAEAYRIYIDVATTEGQRYLVYEPVNNDKLLDGNDIYHGLGSSTDDGDWVTITRDLRSDLADALPDAVITSVNGFLVRGSGRIDDVGLHYEVASGNLSVDVSTGILSLSWSAPSGLDIETIEIRRNLDGEPPKNPSEGLLLAQLAATESAFTDDLSLLSLANRSIGYSVFWKSSGSLYNKGASSGVYCDGMACVTVPDLKDRASVNLKADVSVVRKSLIRAIWGVEELPQQMPVSVVELDPPLDPDSDIKLDYRPYNATVTEELRIDPLDIFIVNNFRMRLYTPDSANNKLIIYHGGHRGIPATRHAVIERFLDEGYSVLDVSMPMAGLNYSQIYHAPYGFYHEDIAYLDKPMRFFFEQISVALNYLKAERNMGDIYMVGISGGAWTTVVYAAIDPRIKASYPVAGSYPDFVAEQLGEARDFEQINPEFYQYASYLDLYLLGAADRRQLLFYNVFDDCCFGGTYSNIFKKQLQEDARRLGGSFDIVLDDSFVGHYISDYALEIIVDDISVH